MGFLDHSTNNIIVDAVLTDTGRQALARNDGSFQIQQFALGDDEVDYNLIRHYGRTVGKEKIEKNTPILEALTAGSLGLKHKLVSVDNEFVTHFPLITVTVGGQSGNSFAFDRPSNASGVSSRSLTVSVAIKNGESATLDNQLEDTSFRVELNSLFFEIAEQGSPDIAYSDNTVVYIVDDSNAGDDQVQATFTLAVKNFSNTTFNVYKNSGNVIKTYAKITGLQSGLSKSITLTIS